MPDGIKAVLTYDGSYEGFLSCVFKSYIEKIDPLDILPKNDNQLSFYPTIDVETNVDNAERVHRSFVEKMSAEAARFIDMGFLTAETGKELMMFKVIGKGYQIGGGIVHCLTDPDVYALDAAVKFLINEAHLLKEFLRFKDYHGTLVAVITPKNFVLPLMAEHFVERYNPENFMIYDETHGAAVIHSPERWEIVAIDDFALAEITEDEAEYQRLWRLFYDTIAIKERKNKKCQMNMMPKRYWRNMVEHQPAEFPGGRKRKRFIGRL